MPRIDDEVRKHVAAYIEGVRYHEALGKLLQLKWAVEEAMQMVEQERPVAHWGGQPVDWDGRGTHASYCIGPCGDFGLLTDCFSSVSCPKCQLMLLEKGEVNAYNWGMWFKTWGTTTTARIRALLHGDKPIEEILQGITDAARVLREFVVTRDMVKEGPDPVPRWSPPENADE